MRITNPSEVKPGDWLVMNEVRTRLGPTSAEHNVAINSKWFTRDEMNALLEAGAIIEREEPMKWTAVTSEHNGHLFPGSSRVGPFALVTSEASIELKGKKFLVTVEEVQGE